MFLSFDHRDYAKPHCNATNTLPKTDFRIQMLSGQKFQCFLRPSEYLCIKAQTPQRLCLTESYKDELTWYEHAGETLAMSNSKDILKGAKAKSPN